MGRKRAAKGRKVRFVVSDEELMQMTNFQIAFTVKIGMLKNGLNHSDANNRALYLTAVRRLMNERDLLITAAWEHSH